MWCWGKEDDSSTCQHMCPAAVHTGTGHNLPLIRTLGGAIAQVHSPPTPTILDPGQGQAQRITKGLLIENVVLFWGRPMLLSQPSSLMPAHLHLERLISQSPFPRATPTPGAGWVLQGYFSARWAWTWLLLLAPYPAHSPSGIPPLGEPPRPWLASADSAPFQCQEGAGHLREGLPKPSSDGASVSSLHWPQILEDSSRGLQGVEGSRSACNSCSSAWLRRYMSM